MQRTSSLARTTLGFSIGAVGLASAFVLIIAAAIIRVKTSHGTPTASDYRWAAAVLLLLIAGFFAVLVAARRAALPIPSARAGFFTGLAGVTLLLSTMMLIGKPFGMRGPMIVAVVAGMASAAGAIRMAKSSRVQTAGI